MIGPESEGTQYIDPKEEVVFDADGNVEVPEPKEKKKTIIVELDDSGNPVAEKEVELTEVEGADGDELTLKDDNDRDPYNSLGEYH